MARVFIDGFESRKWVASQGGLWDAANGTGLNVYTPGYGGVGYCLGTPANGATVKKYIPEQSSYYIGFAFKGNTGNSACFAIMSGSTYLGTLRYDGLNGIFHIYKGNLSTWLQSLSIYVAADVWSHIQMYYVPSTTAGTWILKINGVEAASFSGATALNDYLIDSILLTSAGGACSWYWDNVVVDSDSWPGVTRIAGIFPSGAGNSAQWDPSAGSNWDCVDEVPYSDSDDVSTTVADEVDTYAASDLPSEASVIKSVQVTARARREGAGLPNIALACRTTGGDFYSADQILQTSHYAQSKLWQQNPGTAAAWTVSEVNAMEIGIKSRA